jgi:PIN domain nuclease of toxin-antitoxin system
LSLAVLDSSALLALLLGEPGREQVAAAIGDAAAMTTVNYGEAAGYFARMGASEADIRAMLAPLTVERVPFDEALAMATAMLLPATRSAGLSFGDRACLALARKLAAPALTADRAWAGVAKAVGVDVVLIR